MTKARIPTKPTELRDMLVQAAIGIGGEPNWPPTAPTQGDINTDATNMHNAILLVDDRKAQLDKARQDRDTLVDQYVEEMKRVDQVTDGLYGPTGVEKENFGLTPKKSPGGPSVPLVQVIITKVIDGTGPASIFLNWEPQHGAAAYQVEWSMNVTGGTPLGNAAVSESEYEIADLTMKQQYWIRVRAIRGNEFGPWSDPATRVANI